MSAEDRLKYPELDYLMNESESDVVFVIGGQRVPAIRRVLALKSKVFEAMFSGKFKESEQKEITVEEVTAEAFQVMLRFLYTEQLVVDDSDISRVIDVLRVADRYQIYRLIDLIRDKVRAKLNLANFTDVCQLAYESGTDHLLPDIKHYIEDNFQLLVQKEFKGLKKINEWTDSAFLEVLTTRYRTADRHFGPFYYSETNSQTQGVWKQCCNGQVPSDAVRGGTDLNGEALYVGRAIHLDDCLPGKIVPSHGVCYIACDGQEKAYRQYQVLTNPQKSYFAWQSTPDRELPLTAIVGGQQLDGQKLYVGRTHYGGSLVIGRVHPAQRLLYIPFAGREISCSNYEVLVASDQPCEDNCATRQSTTVRFGVLRVNRPNPVPIAADYHDQEAEAIEFD